MKTILMSTAAAALLFAVPATAQQAAPAPNTDAAQAVPETQIEVEERRQLLVNPDEPATPAGLLVGSESGRYYIDCTDPGIVCENMEGMAGMPATDTEATGSVAPAPVADDAPAAPDTAIGVQERRRLLTDEDDIAPGGATAPQ